MYNQYFEHLLYESDTEPVGLPEGVTFLSDKKGEELDQVIGNISSIFKSHRYKKVMPPIFEYYETFEKGSGYHVARKSFSFKDKDGKMLSLRYDMTTPIARMASMKYSEKDLPIRYYYRGDVFREQPIHAGKPRQLRQVGIELIGLPDIDADVEVVNLLGKSLSEMNPDYRIVLGDIKLYTHILSQLKLTESQMEAVHASMNRKDKISLKMIMENIEGITGYKNLLMRLPSIVGHPEDIRREMDSFNDLGFDIYTDRAMRIFDGIDPEIKKHILLDFSLVKDFSYYTSTTIEGYISSVGYPIANGGRYDELFKAFGKDFPAVGFAIDISHYL